MKECPICHAMNGDGIETCPNCHSPLSSEVAINYATQLYNSYNNSIEINKFKKIVKSDKDTVIKEFKVAGVTFENRQNNLKKIKYDLTNNSELTLRLEKYTFNDNPAFKIFANDLDIGNIPQQDVHYFLIHDATYEPNDLYIDFFVNENSDTIYYARINVIFKKFIDPIDNDLQDIVYINENYYVKTFSLVDYNSFQDNIKMILDKKTTDLKIKPQKYYERTAACLFANKLPIGYIPSESTCLFTTQNYEYKILEFKIAHFVNNYKEKIYFPYVTVLFHKAHTPVLNEYEIDDMIDWQEVLNKSPDIPKSFYLECFNCNHLTPFYEDTCEHCGYPLTFLSGLTFSETVECEKIKNEESEHDECLETFNNSSSKNNNCIKNVNKKIKSGKLTLSLVIYIIGVPLTTILIGFILVLLLNIPVLSWIINFFIKVRESNGWELLALPMSISSFIIFQVSKKINKDSERTHLLATFIFGIIFVSVQALSLIANAVYGDNFLVNIIGIVVGGFLIYIGKEFIE